MRKNSILICPGNELDIHNKEIVSLDLTFEGRLIPIDLAGLSDVDVKISHYGDISRPITSGGQSGPSHGARQQHQLFLKIQLTLINSRRMG